LIGWSWVIATAFVIILYEYADIGVLGMVYMVALITAVDWLWDSLMKLLREAYEEPTK
jgi:hypothetical protein